MKRTTKRPEVDPLTRESLAADAVRRSIRRVNPDIHIWSDEELDASLDATLAQAPNHRHVWIFAYGSLLWNPIIDVGKCMATVAGSS